MLIVGCEPPAMYYWGNYSDTLYKYKKNLTPEMLEKHKIELKTIVNKSDNLGLRTPPGVNAEYGYLLLLEGNTSEAIPYLEKEKSLYPESTKFIDDLINNINEGN